MPMDWEEETHVSEDAESVHEPPADRDRAYLIVLAGSNVGEMFKVSSTDIVLGRGQGADIQLLDDGISRRHACIRMDGGEMVVEDMESRNGTFANGNRINRHVLRDGDKIQVGSTTILKFTYHDNLDETFQRHMYESALRDGLTKAFNKKYFLDRIESEFRFARRHRVPLSVILFDIDHFKKINDTSGHLAGDQVLAALSRKVAETIRAEDVFARYGGEEFAVICRAIEMNGAAAFAERLRSAVEKTEFPFAGKIIPVTVSLGVAGLPQVDTSEPMGLVSAADEALYQAKRSGRNCVKTAPPGPYTAVDAASLTQTRT
jgi:two-component system cell cycle response regulator